MFDLGWTELLLIGIVALIVVGPKDLPGLFRSVGQFVGKARRMAADFSRAMNDAADQAGVNEISKGLQAAANPKKFGVDAVKKATDMGPATEALSKERQEAKEKISAAAAKAAEERQAREAAAEAAKAKAAYEAAEARAAEAAAKVAPKPQPKDESAT